MYVTKDDGMCASTCLACKALGRLGCERQCRRRYLPAAERHPCAAQRFTAECRQF